jgi:hypothetical protein
VCVALCTFHCHETIVQWPATTHVAECRTRRPCQMCCVRTRDVPQGRLLPHAHCDPFLQGLHVWLIKQTRFLWSVWGFCGNSALALAHTTLESLLITATRYRGDTCSAGQPGSACFNCPSPPTCLAGTYRSGSCGGGTYTPFQCQAITTCTAEELVESLVAPSC